MVIIVFASAHGPTLFSFSTTKLGSYNFSIFGLTAVVAAITIFNFKTDNPQNKFESSQ